MTDQRPNPEKFLQRINAETQDKSKGKLKIFFGYSAGVGKTYAMLQEAHSLQASGVDVVMGYVEPHQRADTLALFEGLPQIPLLKLEYKGITLSEFNLDAALERRPKVILVDELAHTNAQGCRRAKRYQDIEELLRMGIDVYTTVNTQHLESLHDVVEAITGVAVRERIPDHVFDSADKVELVDIEPEDLIVRMSEGKVYKELQAKRALGNFFTKENLVALREIALRRTADRVNITVEKNKSADSSKQYFTGEHIMMCLSSSPSNAKVVRTAAKMAEAFHGKFTALFVESMAFNELKAEDKERLQQNLRLAEQLGARIVTVYGDDVAYQMAEYAKASGISKIVLGRPAAKGFLGFRPPNYVDKLTIYAPNIETYVIPSKLSKAYFARNNPKQQLQQLHLSWHDTAKMLGCMSITTLIGFVFVQLGFSEANVITIYILACLLTAAITDGKFYSFLSSALAVAAFNFFFTEPFYSFNFYDSGYMVTFVIMFLATFIMSSFMKKVKEQARNSALVAHRMEVLLETSQRLQKAQDKAEIFTSILKLLQELLAKKVFIYPVNADGLGEIISTASDEKSMSKYMTDNELAVARWVLVNNKHAGATTSTLAYADCLYMSIRNGSEVFAIVGIDMQQEKFIGSFEKSLLIAMLDQAALALERR